jgi:hypothetical protein
MEPRTTLAAWRQAVDDPAADLSPDASRRLARELGAGRVLLGSAIATPGELTLSGSLLRVSDGETVADGSVAGPPDSVAVLVNRLAARLLSLGAGESRERVDGLAAVPLPALQDYLAAQVAYRRGNFFGAMDLYSRALAGDSLFLQAALGLLISNQYIGTVLRVDGFREIPRIWRLRDRLSERDRSLFLGSVFVGANYPGRSTHAETIALAERGAAAAASSAEHWQALGMILLQFGAAASVPDWRARAAAALDRAIALDSSFAPALVGRLYLAQTPAELAATRRLAELLDGPVAAGYTDAMILWAVARLRGDSASAERYRGPGTESRINNLIKLVKIPLHSVQYTMPLGDAHWANAAVRRAGSTEEERNTAWLGERAVAFAEGRLQQDIALWGAYTSEWTVANLLQHAVVEPEYRPLAERHLRELAPGAWPPLRLCYAEVLRASTGDTSGTRAAAAALRGFAAGTPTLPSETWGVLEFRVCPLLLEALVERGAKLDSLEALMRDGPRWFSGGGPPVAPVVAANLLIARQREAEGNLPAALAAVRRREMSYYPAYLWSLPALLRQEGRLAALTGEIAAAVLAYDRYLTLRTDPDPPFRPERDSVVTERAALKPIPN